MTGPLMHIIETVPSSYERFIGPVTLYKIKEVRKVILEYLLHRRSKVLDIGCGAGGLAIELMSKNDQLELYCMDISEEMLKQTESKLSDLVHDKSSAHFINDDVLNINYKFNDNSLDSIINIHLLSEVEQTFIEQLLKDYYCKLKSGGFLFIADELEPKSKFTRAIFYFVRFPFDFMSYLIDRHHELKKISIIHKIKYYLLELSLIVVTYFSNFPVTKPLKNIEDKLLKCGFEIVDKRFYQLETFGLYVAKRK